MGTPSQENRDGVIELAAIGAQELVGLGHADAAEAQPLARLDLAHAPDIERAYRADLRVATRGLPVGQEHDGLAVADDLDAAQRHAVGDDVVAARVLDAGAAEPRAHAVALRRHLVRRRRRAPRCRAAVKRSSWGPSTTRTVGSCRVVGDHLLAHLGGRAARRRGRAAGGRPCGARGPRSPQAGRADRSRVSRAPAACRCRRRRRRRRASPSAPAPRRSTSPASTSKAGPARHGRAR